uniref:Uncharacterized protein n=1 Tax=Lepeophtheirus salmonis TaxID=72036 RepID=A0A0K2TXD4_LEPSM|nr:uncharacterized protein LOC121118618 isoform X2 [Lepeophtheirus salmonis]
MNSIALGSGSSGTVLEGGQKRKCWTEIKYEQDIEFLNTSRLLRYQRDKSEKKKRLKRIKKLQIYKKQRARRERIERMKKVIWEFIEEDQRKDD